MLHTCIVPGERVQKEELVDQRLYKSTLVCIQGLCMCGFLSSLFYQFLYVGTKIIQSSLLDFMNKFWSLVLKSPLFFFRESLAILGPLFLHIQLRVTLPSYAKTVRTFTGVAINLYINLGLTIFFCVHMGYLFTSLKAFGKAIHFSVFVLWWAYS